MSYLDHALNDHLNNRVHFSSGLTPTNPSPLMGSAMDKEATDKVKTNRPSYNPNWFLISSIILHSYFSKKWTSILLNFLYISELYWYPFLCLPFTMSSLGEESIGTGRSQNVCLDSLRSTHPLSTTLQPWQYRTSLTDLVGTLSKSIGDCVGDSVFCYYCGYYCNDSTCSSDSSRQVR